MTSLLTTTAKSAKAKLALTLLGVVAIVAAGAFAVYAATKKPDFKIAVTPTSKTVVKGAATNYDLKITPVRKFKKALSLTVTGLPRGATASWQLPDGRSLPRRSRGGPSVLPKGKKKAKLFVGTADSTPTGTYTVKVTAAGGGKKHSKRVKLTVAPVPAPGGNNTGGGVTQPSEPEPQPQPQPQPARTLAVVATPDTRDVVQTDSTTYAIELTRAGGLSGASTMSVSGLPAGATASFSPASPVAGSDTTLTIDTVETTPTGTYELTVQGAVDGVSGSGVTDLVVQPRQNFTIEGDLAGPLYPGAAASDLDLTLTNPYDFDIKVESLNVSLSTTQPGCDAATNYSVTQASATFPLTLPPGESDLGSLSGVTSVPKVQMLETGSDQGACAGAPLDFDYTGMATK
jgi:hypothetical protein